MPCKLLKFGQYVNDGERRAAEYLQRKLDREDGRWYLLTNVELQLRASGDLRELDLIALGPTGVFVIDVKSFAGDVVQEGATWRLEDGSTRDNPIGHVEDAAKQLKGYLQDRIAGRADFWVAGRLFFTEDQVHFPRTVPEDYCFRMSQYRQMLHLDTEDRSLDPSLLPKILEALEPGVAIRERAAWESIGEFTLDGEVTCFNTPYRRTFEAHDEQGRAAIVRLYDLSAVPAAERVEAHSQAYAEFSALKAFLAVPYVVSFLASFQPVPGYGGELYYFALEQPTGATMADRLSAETETDFLTRLKLARNLSRAIQEIHSTRVTGSSAKTVVHRRLRPENIYLYEDETRFRLTGFDVARSLEETIYPGKPPFRITGYDAPELAEGLSRASSGSDIYSLGVVIWQLLSGTMPFDDRPRMVTDDGPEPLPELETAHIAENVVEDIKYLLGEMLCPAPQDRPQSADEIADLLDEVVKELEDAIAEDGTPAQSEPTPRHPLPEGSPCGDDLVVSQLLALTPTAYVYKVTQGSTGNVFVAKVWRDVVEEQLRQFATEFGALAKLSAATDRIVGVKDVRTLENAPYNLLLEFLPGQSLEDYARVLPERARDMGVPTWRLAAGVTLDVLEALELVHRHGLVHRDLSPSNVVVVEDRAVVIDFGIASEVAEAAEAVGCGTYAVRAPEVDAGAPCDERSDLYSVGVLLFMALTDTLPFVTTNGIDKTALREDLLNEEKLIPRPLADLIRRTLEIAPEDRPASAGHMREALVSIIETGEEPEEELLGRRPSPLEKLERRETDYLTQLLQLYQKSVISNAETRGLDTDFARDTYVDTRLDETIVQMLLDGKLSLVLLTGNPGDGKTAFLQQLALKIGVAPETLQGEREWRHRLQDGRLVACNLDGSAAHRGRRSDEVLDTFLASFFDGPPENETRFVAINDGRLLEWLEVTHQNDANWLFRALEYAVGLTDARSEHIEAVTIIDLNDRSLVGDIDQLGGTKASSVERMIDSLVEGTPDGVSRDEDPWAACSGCRAQDWCHVKFTVDTLRDSRLGPVVRQRIVDLCQIVHFRGRTHITVRQLRGALSYLLFGGMPCREIHLQSVDERPATAVQRSFWQRLWTANEEWPGDLLPELARLDPGLMDHPLTDRDLRARGLREVSGHPFVHSDARSRCMMQSVCAIAADRGIKEAMPILRRRLFFEGRQDYFDQIGVSPAALVGYSAIDEYRLVVREDHQAKQQALSCICEGLSRADRVPPEYIHRNPGVALQSSTETPVDTVIFRHYPASELALCRSEPRGSADFVEWLPTSVIFGRKLGSDDAIELAIGLDLFEYLWRLSQGQAPGAAEFDAIFAHLDVFRDRLLRLPTRELMARHPTHGQFRITMPHDEPGSLRLQRLDG